VDPVPDPLIFRKSGSAVNEPGPLDLYLGTLTTEAVIRILIQNYI
jgi:hypothetical protein